MDTQRFFNIANSLVIVGEDGRHQVKITKDAFYYDPSQYGNEGNPRYIIATNAITTEGEAELKKFIESMDENTTEEELQAALNSVTLTYSAWLGSEGEVPEFLPAKGEQVNITCGMVPTREGGESLRITSLTQLHKGFTRKASFKKAEVEVPAVQ